MKSQYVNELRSGQTVKEKFVLTKKTVKDKRDGGYYAILEFSDRTGYIDGISWDSNVLANISASDFVFITGNVAEYNGRLQVVINSINKVDDDDVDALDFLPRYAGDIEKVINDIREFKTRVKGPALRKLLDSFFDDHDFVKLLGLAPAAKKVHHAYLGGLAVHTLSVLRLLDSIMSAYNFLSADLLITAGILHDVGKIYEYTYKKRIDFSDRGRLLGHIVIGSEMVAARIGQIPDFPADLSLKILHMILSHHGEVEWGSPKPPLFPEALVLHFADNLDAKMEMMKQVVDKHRGGDKPWSNYHPYLEREIFLGYES
ncbi:MAG: HD domain-containing protein [bacterium]